MSKTSKNPADALRDVPPREFVRARQALVEQLAKDGKAAEARAIARLSRPSPVVWALNRTAMTRPRDLDGLAQAVDRLRRAQLGQGELRTATERYRAAFEPLVRSAEEALRAAASAVSPALDRRIRSTLLAAITDRRLRADLAAGRLAAEHADPGFAVLSRGPIPAEFLRDRPGKGGRPNAPPGPDERREAAAAARRARHAGREARNAARQARGAARALDLDARRKERAAQAAEEKASAARSTLRVLEQRSAVLRASADQARQASQQADERARAMASRADRSSR